MRLISSTLLLSILSLSSPVLSTTNTSNDPSNTSTTTSTNASTPEHSALIARANTLLSTGQFADAARVYSEALEQTPNDYVLYYKRATAYLSSNRHAPALDDFDTVLKLTEGSFDKALIAKARIYTKEGRWVEGREALTEYSKKVQGNKEAQELMFAVSDGEIASKKATKAQKSNKWDECISAATTALQAAPYSASLRQQRADCALAGGDVEQAIADLTRLTHLGTANTALLLRVSALSYFLSSTSEQGLKTLKQCLHFDPDSKPCKAAHRLLKALDKQFDQLEKAGQDVGQVIKIVTPDEKGLAAKFDKALEDVLKGLDSPLPTHIQPKKQSPRRLQIWRAACKAYVQNNEIRKAEKWCSEVLRMDAENEDGLVGAGEVALKNEEWEEAVRFFDRAFNASGKQNHDVLQRLQKAQRLLKQAKKKDYYKVLGVSRDADQKTIKKAFRKKAIEVHPDKGGTESKMAAVNEAYEVLSNPELRQRYDNGDDPNDPESQQGGHPFHGSPFQFFQQQGGSFGGQGGHFRHGGGGQQFNFRFN